jgi:hypothetical protein
MNGGKSCGCTASQALADAKTLGLQQEFQSGIYTCCQMAAVDVRYSLIAMRICRRTLQRRFCVMWSCTTFRDVTCRDFCTCRTINLTTSAPPW